MQQSRATAVPPSRQQSPSIAASASASCAAAAAAAILAVSPLQASELQTAALVNQSPVLLTTQTLLQQMTEGISALDASCPQFSSSQQVLTWFDSGKQTARDVALTPNAFQTTVVIADLNPLTWFREKPPPPPPSPFDFLPSIGSPFEVIGYLLQHPVAALVVGGGAAIFIPRVVRFSIRFVVVPAVVILLGWIAFNNPSSASAAVSGLFSTVVAHPMATSTVILLGASFLLSPYILVAVVAVVLSTGSSLLPSFLRPALPGPVNEAFKQVDVAQEQLQSVWQQLTEAVKKSPALRDGS